MEKERETARMEAKRRKLMEKKVREHGLTRFCFYCFFFFFFFKFSEGEISFA